MDRTDLLLILAGLIVGQVVGLVTGGVPLWVCGVIALTAAGLLIADRRMRR
jgi:hypothetical protein